VTVHFDSLDAFARFLVAKVTTPARPCGNVCPRTTPPGCFVCDRPEGHAGPHTARIGELATAMWTEPPEAA
jgi:hypothetical protein